MPGELELVLSEFLYALDSKDVDSMIRNIADDAQSVDEISRRWLLGRGEVEDYLRQLMDMVSEVRTEVRDPNERVWGDTGVLTCWLEQDYTMRGNAQHVSAPTTVVFNRVGGEWKLALFHSIPLPEQQ